MKIRQHLPDWADFDSKEEFFETTDELLKIEWIKLWAVDMKHIRFWRYSQSEYGKEWALMAEYKTEGKHEWYVIGFMSSKTELPEWIPDGNGKGGVR